ncbi:quinon protein alcohol dehydrogenase-like superfamily [Calycina marina]|uniref:Quinon protein alcohol dehydrogenase-like superfamily n=1 Tax=Calycina marina TaxID=1763456 RepID=A0A9P7YZP4_9HELO|nr:quinon protein alcohol dehydrogenase-like superfamily [Calycina marina]
MSSGTVELKRKRLGPNLSEKHKSGPPIAPIFGWDAAFELPEIVPGEELVAYDMSGQPISGTGVDEWKCNGEIKEQKEETERQREEVQLYEARQQPAWNVSSSIGGRMINADPVFTQDEKFLILANRSSISVYSTSNSLLTTTLIPKVDVVKRPNARIIAYCISPTNPDHIWVAFADGAIYYINWISGEGADEFWTLSSNGCIHMTVASMVSGGRRRDVVFATELRSDKAWRITANELSLPGSKLPSASITIFTSTQMVNYLKSANEGEVLVATAEKSIMLGFLATDKYETLDKIRYEFRVFDSSAFISAIDVRCSIPHKEDEEDEVVAKRKGKKQKQKQKPKPIVDVVVGDAKGSIFVHNDLLRNLLNKERLKQESNISLLPQKLHWHRQGVQTVKWSLDGAYIISGGSETVLVLWQLDTGRHQFLPHMAATIQNVVVSPAGTSYAVQLKDNSAMILSTAELKATSNVAGIQSSVLAHEESIEVKVQRVEDEPLAHSLFQRTPATINPSDPSQLLVAVGQEHELHPIKPLALKRPYLQTFDLKNARSVGRQALTRSNITNINVAPGFGRMTEPTVTHMKLSFDGKWLATIDEWTPSEADLEHILHAGMDGIDERWRRREVCLKFWQMGQGEVWELVSRINAPHSFEDAAGAGRVLDLAADPSSTRFSTIGDDAVVRTWVTRSRKRDNVVVRGRYGTPLKNWDCHQSASMGKHGLDDNDRLQPRSVNGCVAFSEDGSILAVAAGGDNDGLLHLLDADSGTIRLSLNKMYEGHILQIDFLGQDLITLSDKVLLYDIAANEMRLSFGLTSEVTKLELSQKLEMLHLAVDPKSRTFAVATPGYAHDPKNLKTLLNLRSLLNQCSHLVVFSPKQRLPVFKQIFGTVITALLPAIGSEGFMFLDSAAEIYTCFQQGTHVVTAMAQSTSALKLEGSDNEAEDTMDISEDEDEHLGFLPGEDKKIANNPNFSFNFEDDETPVVTQQKLSEVFDIGPSFALPPMEELFYQVAGLFLGPPMTPAT